MQSVILFSYKYNFCISVIQQKELGIRYLGIMSGKNGLDACYMIQSQIFMVPTTDMA